MNNMLYFRLSEMLGFTSSKLADQQQGFAIPIRELIQNSLDASKEGGKDCCKVNIYLEYINKNQIPCIKQYEQILKKAIETQESFGSYQRQQIQVVEKINDALNKDTLQILTFSDNGNGLTLEKFGALLEERSHKDSDNSSGGSYGVGHLTAYSLSALRYVLYTSRYNDSDGENRTLFSGSPILAGYSDQDGSQRGPVGRIVSKEPSNERNPEYDYPTQPPTFLEDKLSDINPNGTIVSVLGLSEDWSEEAEYSIASNFFHALLYESLSVTIHRKNEDPISMRDVMEQRLSDRRSQKNAGISRGYILSGQAAWQSYQAVKEEYHLKPIPLQNGDNVHVYLNTTSDIPESSVALIRSNMLVARHDRMISPDFDRLRKNWEFAPFTLVIDVDSGLAPTLFGLVKGAEGPYHNQLVPNKLSKHDENLLKSLFTELSKSIEPYLKKIDRKSFELPLFTVQGNAKSKSSSGNQISSDTKEAKTVKRDSPTPKVKDVIWEPRNSNNKVPSISGRKLKSRISARYIENKNFLTAELSIVPREVHSQDSTWLSFCLGEDIDRNSGTSIWLKFDSVTINDQQVDLEDNERIVNLGQLADGVTYRVSAQLHKPEEHIGTFKCALQPILGVRRS